MLRNIFAAIKLTALVVMGQVSARISGEDTSKPIDGPAHLRHQPATR